MKRPENDKWLDEVLSETIGSKKPRTDFEVWKQKHPEAVEMLTSRVNRQTSASKHPLSIRNKIMKSPITKLAAAAVIVIAVFIGIDQFDKNGSSVVWADVAERFESVPFFNITIYLCDPSNKTKKIEIWKSEDSRIRAHEGNTVFFADISKDKNKFTIFDRSTKKLLNGDENLPTFIWRLCGKKGRFSLDTLTKSFPSDVKGIIPLETADTAASKETVLFKAKAKEITPEALKIWALRESKLPIRFFVRPSKGYFDLFFDYSEQKDAAFFDPVAFTNQ
ncbi:MAG: hypothetical protein GY774_08880 [Planctomycetes bacterium]|nr:hypothetical protein [Planctomycetota bacterium]